MTPDKKTNIYETTTQPIQTQFIGKKNELDTLKKLGETVMAGLGRVVVILGEPGIGKTRLISTWKEDIEKIYPSERLVWVEAQASDLERELVYHLVKGLLKGILNQLSPQIPKINRSIIDELLVEKHRLISPDDIHYLAYLLEVDTTEQDETIIKQLSAKDLHSHYINAIKNLIKGLAENSPLFIILEDLQWADQSSVEFLAEILSLSNRYPILFCLVSRHERHSTGWKLITSARDMTEQNYLEIHLDSLSQEESQQLLNQYDGSKSIPQEIRQVILEKSEGNPFFLEELTRMVMNGRVSDHESRHWEAADVLEIQKIPDTLQGVLTARMEQVDPKVRQLLKVASVIGQSFSLSALEAVVEDQTTKGQTLDLVNKLEKAGMIQINQVKPELVYKFRHMLLHQAVYNTIDDPSKTELHLLVGSELEHLYADRIEKFASQLADHFLKANKKKKSLTYLIKAGEIALRAYASSEAESIFIQAIKLTDIQSKLAHLYTNLGLAQANQARHPEAIVSWQKALPLHKNFGNTDQLARIYARMARSTWGRLTPEDRQNSLKICLEGLESIEGAPESPDIAYLIHETGRSFAFNLIHNEAKVYAEKALKMAAQLNAYEVQAESLSTISILPPIDLAKSINFLKEAIKISEEHKLYGTGARAYNNLSAVIQFFNDYEKARAYRVKALSLAEKSSSSINPMILQQEIIAATLWIGDDQNIETELDETKRHLEKTIGVSDRRWLNFLLLESAHRRFKGDFSAAAEILSELIEQSKHIEDFTRWLEGKRAFTDMAMESYFLEIDENKLPDINTIIRDLENTLAANHGIPFQTKAVIQCLISVMYAIKGDLSKSETALDSANKIFKEINSSIISLWQLTKINLPHMMLILNRPFIVWTTLTQARIEVIKINYDSAIILYNECIQTIKEKKGKWWEARIKLELGIALLKRKDIEDIELAQSIFREARTSFSELDSDYYANIAIEKLRQVKQISRAQVLAHKKLTRELAEGGKIQNSLLPTQSPTIDGLNISGVLLPALDMSGDFYDYYQLENNKLGVVIADVADKGAGAALYMAMSRTLFRTYTVELNFHPQKVFQEINRRLLSDTKDGLFLTAFLAIIDVQSGLLTYVNAGHTPPYLINKKDDQVKLLPMERTGPLLGIFSGTEWQTGEVSFDPGDALVLYTDGITEAQDQTGIYYGYKNFLESLKSNVGLEAEPLRNAILKDLLTFTGDAPRLDDITLSVIRMMPA